MPYLDSWNETPFIHHFVNLKSDQRNNALPFVIGGATQQGVAHRLENQNNQDAICIEFNNNYIAGVVCDGCTGTHNSLRNSFSNNEVGAKLFSKKIIEIIKNNVADNQLRNGELVNRISEGLISDFSRLVDAMCPNSEEDKEVFIFDFLMTTIIGFVVTSDKYIVFNCGDGIFGVNERVSEIQESGKYFSENLLKVCCPSKYANMEGQTELKVCAEGSSSDLDNIFIASDGLLPLVLDFPNVLLNFTNRIKPKAKNGFDFLLQDLRMNVITQEQVSTHSLEWLKDDCSFLLLSRTERNNRIIKVEVEKAKSETIKQEVEIMQGAERVPDLVKKTEHAIPTDDVIEKEKNETIKEESAETIKQEDESKKENNSESDLIHETRNTTESGATADSVVEKEKNETSEKEIDKTIRHEVENKEAVDLESALNNEAENITNVVANDEDDNNIIKPAE